MLLNQIATSGFAGIAPTPVERYAISKYFVNNDLFNLMEFVNIGMGSNIGNLQVTVVTYDTPDEATTRRIGNEYPISNNVPQPVTLVLKMLGGEFQTDRVLERAFSQNPTALDNWTEQQIGQKINAIINGFAKMFIGGDTAVNPDGFDGLNKFFDNNPGQVLEPMVLPNGLTIENVLSVESYINSGVALLKDYPTCVITTRTKGKPFLQTIEQFRNRGIRAITVNEREYYTFMGIPIVGVEESAFPEDMLAKGIPFIFCRFGEIDGIRVAVPMNPGIGSQGAILDIVRPRMNNVDTGEAVFVRNGGVEIVCVPIMVDPYCASLVYVSETEFVPVTSVTVTGDATITGQTTKQYTATVAPETATVKDVTWSVVGDAFTVDQSGQVTSVKNGVSTLVATAKDDSGVKGTIQITVSGIS